MPHQCVLVHPIPFIEAGQHDVILVHPIAVIPVHVVRGHLAVLVHYSLACSNIDAFLVNP